MGDDVPDGRLQQGVKALLPPPHTLVMANGIDTDTTLKRAGMDCHPWCRLLMLTGSEFAARGLQPYELHG